MSHYADVFVCPVPTARKREYRAIAELSRTVWLEHGALDYHEFETDDVQPGKLTSFPQSVDLRDGEEVVVALISYRSREHRDEVNAKAIADPRMAGMDMAAMPFDTKRMFFGGFRSLVGGTRRIIRPYLFLRGRCREAIDYYKAELGAEVGLVMLARDNPDHPDPASMPAEEANRIMHAELRVAGGEVWMADGTNTGPVDFACMSLALEIESVAEAERLFAALAREGVVHAPIAPTFFASRYGAVVDKLGVSWFILVPLDASTAEAPKA